MVVQHPIWRNARFEKLSLDDKLFALHVVTWQSNRIGLFALDWDAYQQLCDCGNSLDAACRPWRVSALMGWQYDNDSGVLYIPEWWDYWPPGDERELRDCLGDLDQVPPNPFLDEFLDNAKYLSSEMAEVLRRFAASHRQPPGEPKLAEDHSEETSASASLRLVASEDASEGEVVLSFPTVGGSENFWPLTRKRMRDLESLYPFLDVSGECRKALAWVMANPRRRKTNAGMMRFLVNWLNRSSNYRSRTWTRDDPRGNMETARLYLAETANDDEE